MLVERRRDGVALVTLNNPKVNALSLAVLDRLHAIALDLIADPPGSVVVTGGDRLFAAGADISEFGGPEEAEIVGSAFHRALDAVASIPRFVIAAVTGYALGGGCELALACDYRIAGEKAVFGQPEIQLGIIPGGGGTQRLTRAVGPSRAKELMITGRQVGAHEAVRIGLADEIVPHTEVHLRALSLAASVAAGASVAQGMIKTLVDRGSASALTIGLEEERRAFTEVFETEDSRIGVESFLANGPGKATFVGR